jgi:hypothetical protein
MKLIPLSMWAERKFERPPSSRTLRRWAENGNIFPPPKKYGRPYMVQENARYVDPSDPDYLADLHESSAQ